VLKSIAKKTISCVVTGEWTVDHETLLTHSCTKYPWQRRELYAFDVFVCLSIRRQQTRV